MRGITVVTRMWSAEPHAPKPVVRFGDAGSALGSTPITPAAYARGDAEDALPISRLDFFYTNVNHSMRSITHNDPDQVIVFVDQRVAELTHTEHMIQLALGGDCIVSAKVRISDFDDPEPWHEPVSPFAWASTCRVLAKVKSVWEHHLLFDHELLMGDMATANPGIEILYANRTVARVDNEEASAACNALYYRQLEDAAAVAKLRGVEGPSG